MFCGKKHICQIADCSVHRAIVRACSPIFPRTAVKLSGALLEIWIVRWRLATTTVGCANANARGWERLALQDSAVSEWFGHMLHVIQAVKPRIMWTYAKCLWKIIKCDKTRYKAHGHFAHTNTSTIALYLLDILPSPTARNKGSFIFLQTCFVVVVVVVAYWT